MASASDSRTLVLLRDLFVRSSSDVFNAIVSLAIITLVAQRLDVAQYGVYAQALTTVSVLLPVVLLRLNTACVRFFPTLTYDPDKRREQFSMLVLLVLLLSGAVAGLFMLFAMAVAKLIFGIVVAPQLMSLLAAYLMLRCMVTLLTDYFRAMNQPSVASAYNSLRFAMLLAVLLYSLSRLTQVTQVLEAYLLAEGIVLLVLLLHLVRAGALGPPMRWRPQAIRPYLLYSLPLVPYSLFLAVNQFSDRYFITQLINLEAAGIYSYSYNLITAAFLLNASMSYVIYPHLCRFWEQGKFDAVNQQLHLGQRIFMFIGVPIAVGLYAIYAALISELAGPAFVLDSVAVVAIVIGQLLFGLCSLFGFIIDLSKNTMLYLRILFMTAALNLLLNAVMVPLLGIAGAALATAVTYGIQLLLMWRNVRPLVDFPVRIDLAFMGQCGLMAMAMFAGLQFQQPLEGVSSIVLAVFFGATLYFGLAFIFMSRHITAAKSLLTNN